MSRLNSIFEVRANSKESYNALEGVRALAVVLVFLTHFSSLTLNAPFTISNSFANFFSISVRDIGNIGVEIFFIISGFLIYGSLIKKAQPFGKYFVRRIIRIYPTFIVIFLVYLGISYFLPNMAKFEWNADGFLYIFQNLLLLPGIFDIEPIITVAWSLSFEMAFYIVTPIVIGVLSMRRWRVVTRVYAIEIVCLVLLLVGLNVESTMPYNFLYFFIGILVCELLKLQNVSKSAAGSQVSWIGFVSIILLLLMITGRKSFAIDDSFVQIVKLVLMFTFMFDVFLPASLSKKIFSFLPLRWIGNMSYSFYLCHSLALQAVFILYGRFSGADEINLMSYCLLFIVSFIGSLLLSAFVFVLVEKPLSLKPRA